MSTHDFLARPGRSGGFGALMDEYARAAEELCRVAERFDVDRWRTERSSEDPDTVSPRMIAAHCVAAGWGYDRRIRQVSDQPSRSPHVSAPDDVGHPTNLRARLVDVIRATEASTEALRNLRGREVIALSFVTPWGQTYDPDSMLEHAVMHLHRHRRQLGRW